MDRFRLNGLGVALVTPFTKEKRIDFNALEKVLDHLLAGGADFLVVLGTTGETPTLSEEERLEIRRFVLRHVGRKIPLVLGYGSNCTDALVGSLKNDDLSGFSAILSVVPPYNKPSQEGLFQHYSRIAESSPLPVVLYNVPGRTGVNMTAETTLRLARSYPNIIGIKEASGNFSQIEKIIKGKPENFQVTSGDDGITYPLMAMGAVGVISVIGNAFPKEFGRMVRLLSSGKYDEARPIHEKFTELFNLLFVDGNPSGVKCVLNALGLVENELRLPLVPTRIETNEEIHRIMRELRLIR